MLIRKIYLKIRLFFYSIRHFLNVFAVTLMSLTLLYLFLNNVFFERIILPEANAQQINNKCDTAINLYNFAQVYYAFNHFSEKNKEIYFEISYEKSVCYLNQNKTKESVNTMLEAITSVQKEYGIFSAETAYFIRKYLIEYYLKNDNIPLAKQEFNNLITIYKKIGYTNNIMSDLICLSGDIYYQQKRYSTAMAFYEKAYSVISTQKNIDYEVFAKIVNRICTYEVQKGNSAEAIDIYKKSIEIFKASGKSQNDLTAIMLMDLGNLYKAGDKNLKPAIQCYEEAIALIKKLPKTSYLKQNIKTYYLILKELYSEDGQFHKVSAIDIELARTRRFSFLF